MQTFEKRELFHDTKRYLSRVRVGRRRIDLLKRREELLDPGTPCRYELHQKLIEAEQDMKAVTIEVMELISILPSVNQQMVMTRRYVDQRTWEEISEEMHMSVRTVQMLHGRALPKVKEALAKDTGKDQE